jgi:hypothetical protein
MIKARLQTKLAMLCWFAAMASAPIVVAQQDTDGDGQGRDVPPLPTSYRASLPRV